MTTKDDAKAEPKNTQEEAVDMCPYWHQVASDFASMYPSRRILYRWMPQEDQGHGGKDAGRSLPMHYSECEGYQRVLAEEEAKERKTPDTVRK